MPLVFVGCQARCIPVRIPPCYSPETSAAFVTHFTWNTTLCLARTTLSTQMAMQQVLAANGNLYTRKTPPPATKGKMKVSDCGFGQPIETKYQLCCVMTTFIQEPIAALCCRGHRHLDGKWVGSNKLRYLACKIGVLYGFGFGRAAIWVCGACWPHHPRVSPPHLRSLHHILFAPRTS